MSGKYGQTGKPYTIGNAHINIDDDFIIATLLAVVGLLGAKFPDFDKHTAATAEKIYGQIKQENPST